MKINRNIGLNQKDNFITFEKKRYEYRNRIY